MLGFATSPSDVVAFHQAALHGGGSCLRGERRRTIALRFVGPDCWKSERAGGIERVGVIERTISSWLWLSQTWRATSSHMTSVPKKVHEQRASAMGDRLRLA